MSSVGIVGCGVVGNACAFGFQKLGHEVLKHDIKWEDSRIERVLKTDIVFVCVPTPSKTDGSCDISIVEDVVEQLHLLNYAGIIAIKSTVEPGTTSRLISEYSDIICFVPEFLRERCAISDFVENHDLLAVGTYDRTVYEHVVNIHGNYPRKTIMIQPTEAELLKYFSNSFNALKITFANQFFDVCESLKADYKQVKDAYIMRGFEPDMYLDVNDSFRGYGGMCLPKDVKALAHIMRDSKDNVFNHIDKLNSTYKTTVPGGMRL